MILSPCTLSLWFYTESVKDRMGVNPSAKEEREGKKKKKNSIAETILALQRSLNQDDTKSSKQTKTKKNTAHLLSV